LKQIVIQNIVCTCSTPHTKEYVPGDTWIRKDKPDWGPEAFYWESYRREERRGWTGIDLFLDGLFFDVPLFRCHGRGGGFRL